MKLTSVKGRHTCEAQPNGSEKWFERVKIGAGDKGKV